MQRSRIGVAGIGNTSPVANALLMPSVANGWWCRSVSKRRKKKGVRKRCLLVTYVRGACWSVQSAWHGHAEVYRVVDMGARKSGLGQAAYLHDQIMCLYLYYSCLYFWYDVTFSLRRRLQKLLMLHSTMLNTRPSLWIRQLTWVARLSEVRLGNVNHVIDLWTRKPIWIKKDDIFNK